MRPRARLAFVIALGVIVSSASQVAAQKQPTTTVTRLYTGADGQSHAEDSEVAWRPARRRRRRGADRGGVSEGDRRAVPALAARLRVGRPSCVETSIRDHHQRTW